jgi:hypothetical protein
MGDSAGNFNLAIRVNAGLSMATIGALIELPF